MEKAEDDSNKNLVQTQLRPAEKTISTSNFRNSVWQIVPSICASAMCVPFGLMLGWPSPTYPHLISSSSPIPITIDQSAMVAGFLMLGNSFGSPFSSTRLFGAKYGVFAASVAMLLGWLLLWQAKDIYWLLLSRFVVGMGHGFGMGQLRYYICEICREDLAPTMLKQAPLYAYLGVLLAICIGDLCASLEIICVVISILVMFVTIFLPSTPRQLVKDNNLPKAKQLIKFLSPRADIFAEIVKIKAAMQAESQTFGSLLKNAKLRKNLLIFWLLIFFQQFSGAPATIIYSQIMFEAAGAAVPAACAMFYAAVFFLANIVAVFGVARLSRRYALLLSSVGVSLVLLTQIVFLVERINETVWPFSSLLLMSLYIVAHSLGLGNVPFMLIPDLFPKQCHRVVIQFFIINFSMLALIITKIFQVLYSQVGIFAPFCLFFTVATFAIFFVLVFVPSDAKLGGVK